MTTKLTDILFRGRFDGDALTVRADDDSTGDGTTLTGSFGLTRDGTPMLMFSDARASWCANPNQIVIGTKAPAGRTQIAVRSYSVS